ncbi:MAG TPA: YraN family protein [Pyrinomonadaceae bacterium]|jgi:putative endonuclease
MPETLTLKFDQKAQPASNTAEIGQIGENFAAQFLIRRGLRLVCSNFKVPIGRNIRGASVSGEIDLIALDAGELVFIEVKTRSSDEFASPLSAIDLRKQRQITRTARVYRKIFNLQNIKFRYDALGIVLRDEKSPKIEHFKNFWTEDKFRKKFWNDEIW